MISVQFIRHNPEVIKEAMDKRNDAAPVDEVLRLDEEQRKLQQEIDELRARRNKVSKEIGKKKKGPPGKPPGETPGETPGTLPGETPQKMIDEMREEMRQVGDRIKSLEQQASEISEQLTDLLLRIPNIPQDSVPIGKDESDNIVTRSWGEIRQFDFPVRPHWELGEALGIIDFERGTKLSGSRFYVLRGLGAQLQRALINFMLDVHINEYGYSEVYPPFMVKRECMVGSGNLPKFGENLYHDQEEDFWFVPTAEVPLTNLYRDEILDPGTLPIYHVAYTACFRREKMSAGKDVRGIKRGHQFDKVELYKFCEPETSNDELETMVEAAETICRKLELPYRVLELCTADLGFPSSRSYDIEAWAPGCAEWLEVSSCSNCLDFQARRTNIRYRPEAGAKAQYPHTLNGSGLALPRIVISILENYQQADGSIKVPEALRPYMGNIESIR